MAINAEIDVLLVTVLIELGLHSTCAVGSVARSLHSRRVACVHWQEQLSMAAGQTGTLLGSI